MSVEVPAEYLLARAAQQDSEALSALYDLYAPRVYGTAMHILADREAAESALQEVFARLWHESASLHQEGGSVVAWLVITARDLAVERLRESRQMVATSNPPSVRSGGARVSGPSARKSKALPSPSADGTKAAKPEAPRLRSMGVDRSLARESVAYSWLPRPKEISIIDDRLPLLYKVIDHLPKSQQEALKLAVFGGRSEVEIAAETGEPLGKVQRSLRAAVTFIKHRRRAVCGTWTANI